MNTLEEKDSVFLQGQVHGTGSQRDLLMCIRFDSKLGTFSVVASLQERKLLEVHLLSAHQRSDQQPNETWPCSNWKHANVESSHSKSLSYSTDFDIRKETWCIAQFPLRTSTPSPLVPSSAGMSKSQETDLLELLQCSGEQLRSYAIGDRKIFDLPLRLSGTPFQNKVWQALLDIPYGQTCTYGELAKKIGNPKGSRAVGGALNRNPLGIIVPCHRVVGANGELTGFAGGLDLKKRLLELECRSKIE